MDQRLFTVAQVRAVDAAAIAQLRVSGAELMQRAARSAWQVLRERWPEARSVTVLCGTGNNGGDGYWLACLARAAGMQAAVVGCGEPASDDARHACAQWRECGGRIVDAGAPLPLADVYVDALFGTGLKRPPQGRPRAAIECLNERDAAVLALDVPSGVDADSGACADAAVRASATVEFVAHKRGLFTGAALARCGALLLAPLDLPQSLFAERVADASLLDSQRMAQWLPPRPRDAHKGDCGHVLAIGGDCGTAGAIALCGEAALRAGAGRVSVATRAANVGALNARRPELMAHAVESAEAGRELLEHADVLALGPGMGQGEWGVQSWRMALDSDKPAVIDADALNLLASQPRSVAANCVLTPHPGEAARLLGTSIAKVEADRYAAARALAGRHRAVVVLKGAGTLVATPQGAVEVCPWGNPGMASGGMGDVLTGVIAALMAQGLDAWRAARLGVALHARAGDAAARDGEAGMIASDLFAHLRRLRNGEADA